jgi:hypothetical protein
MPFDTMEPQRLACLCELYKRHAGDPRQGIPYDELVDALGFDERVTKQFQGALQAAGWVDLTAVPRTAMVGRLVMDSRPGRRHGQTIGMTPRGAQRTRRLLGEAWAQHSTPVINGIR